MYSKLLQFCEDNGLTLSGRLEYGRYGDGLMSITEILGLLVDPSFEYIKNKHSEKLQEACNRGTEIHGNIENRISNRNSNVTITTPGARFYRRWREWKVCSGIEIIKQEETFIKDNIRGTIDAITNIGVVDYKTSLRENEKYKLQIAAYCRLSGETSGGILYLGEDKYIFTEVDIEKYMPIFLELLEYSKSVIAINTQ